MPHADRGVAGDARVLAGGQRGRSHLEAVADRLGRLAEVVAGDEGRPVGRQDELVGGEALLDPGDRRVRRAGVHPRHQPESEEVLRALGIARLDAERRGDLLRQRRHRHADHAVPVEAAVVEWVGDLACRQRVAGLLQVALVERVLVDDQRATLLQPPEIGPQGGRVHRHQHVRLITRRGDRVVRDVHLEAGHAVHRAGRGTDLGGELGERRQVVAVRRADRGETVARQLHAVAGVSGEADDDPVEDRRSAVALVASPIGGDGRRRISHGRRVGVVAGPLRHPP